MKNQFFDILICAQVSLRANILSKLIPAKLKIGYDKARAKDMHSAFIHQSIPPALEQHVLDSFFSFLEFIGLNEREMQWNYTLPNDALEFANHYIDRNRKNIIISPCSSHPKRNWASERYAAVADYAIQNLNANVLLCGGPSQEEQKVGAEIENSMQCKANNLIGKDTLKKLLALLQQADVSYHP